MEKRFQKSINILITGPESTGKSDMASYLASKFNGELLPEYAREYLEAKGPQYTYEDVISIAKEQLIRRNDLMSKPGIHFFDTDLLVCRIWLEHVFGQCPHWIIKESESHLFSHILLMNIDLPWQEDPLREHPHQREELFRKYEKALVNSNRPYSLISGLGEQRLQLAASIIEEIIEKGTNKL